MYLLLKDTTTNIHYFFAKIITCVVQSILVFVNVILVLVGFYCLKDAISYLVTAVGHILILTKMDYPKVVCMLCQIKIASGD